MATQASSAQLVAALYRIPGKAQIVDGEIVLMSPTGGLPSAAAAAIYRSLWEYGRRTGSGRAYTDNVRYVVDLPRRKLPGEGRGPEQGAGLSLSGSR